MDVDLESMCRLCASKNGFKVNLFEKRLGYIDKIKRFIPSLKIPQDDKLPSMICFRCAMLIGDFEKFCLNCVQVQETFLKMKDDQTLSLSEKHTDREPKSNNNGDDDDDDDDAANLNDHDSDHESGVNNRESNDSSTESNIETESRSTEKRIKKRRVSKNGTPIGDKHPPRDDENSHEATASGVNGEKPKHMKETAIPLPELGSCQLIYTCDYCNQSFLTKSVAYSHVCDNMMNNCKRDDVGERSNSYTCELCYQVFSRQAVLQAHRVGHMHESSGEGSGDEVYDEDACVFGQKRRKKRRGGRVTRDGLDYTPFFQENDQETE